MIRMNANDVKNEKPEATELELIFSAGFGVKKAKP